MLGRNQNNSETVESFKVRVPPSRWTFENVSMSGAATATACPKNAEETPGNLEGCEADERPRPDRDWDPPLELYCW